MAQAQAQKILVVDDEQSISDLIATSLRFVGFDVQTAANGSEALTVAEEFRPDALVLDVMMPGMDGFEVARRMREHPTSETIPVIFVTAMTGDDARLKGLELGAVDFVTKPINPNVLQPRVRVRRRCPDRKPAAPDRHLLRAVRIRPNRRFLAGGLA